MARVRVGRVGVREVRVLVTVVAAIALSGGFVLLPQEPSATAGPGGVVTLTPTRILDTREQGQGPCLTAGVPRELTVAGTANVPANASAIVANVTVTEPDSSGYVTVYPAGVPRPIASNLNYLAGHTVPNSVTVKVGAGGKVNLFSNNGCPHVVVDVVAYSLSGSPSANGGLVGTTPTRALDTRDAGQGPCLTAGAPRELTVAGAFGVPADASAVVANVTVTEPNSSGYVTVYPAGVARPTASNLNYLAGHTVPNSVTVKVGTGGKVNLFSNNGCPHVVVDIVGHYTGGTPVGDSGFNGLTPTRVLDTREPGQGPCISGWSPRPIVVAGANGVPSGATGVVLNVTVTEPTDDGFLTVFPGPGVPFVSNLNFIAGQTVPNAVTVGVGPQDSIGLIANSGCPDVIIDVVGYYGPATPLTGVTAVDMNSNGGWCSIVADGRVTCLASTGRPTYISGVTGATDIATSRNSGCAVLGGGAVRCWGNNSEGQLGDGTTTSPAPDTSVQVQGLTDAVEVVSGGGPVVSAFCARLGSGAVQCWGAGTLGHLGNGTTASSSTPVTATGVTGATDLSSQETSICAIVTGATVKCWGMGPLGNGSAGTSTSPVDVSGVTGAQRLADASGTTCAVLTDNTVRCWGNNALGQLGDGTTTERLTAVEPVGLGAVSDISATYGGACAVTSGAVKCWGQNSGGRVGTPVGGTVPTPTAITGINTAVGVSTGDDSACALLSNGTPICWGENVNGQLGNGTTTSSSTPVPATGIADATAISTENNVVCATRASTQLACWGYIHSPTPTTMPSPQLPPT